MSSTTLTPKPEPSTRQRTFMVSLGAGSGFALAVALLQLLKPNATQLLTTVGSYGPLFLLIVLGMLLFYLMVNRWGEKAVEAIAANAAAQQSMADAMQRIAAKDDIAARERELLLDHLSYTTKRILEKVEAIGARQLTGSAEGDER